MELKEARKIADKLGNGDIDLPVCLAELINTIIALETEVKRLDESLLVLNTLIQDVY